MTTKPTAADQWTFRFYGAAAVTSLVGQIWAGGLHVDLAIVFALKCLFVAVPVAVVELFGVAMAARADMRMRAGHSGLRYLILSACGVAFGVAFNFFGHFENGQPSWWSWLFAGIGLGGYIVFLFHSADRRNDAAEDRQHRAGASPDYGLWRRVTQRDRVRLATELAQEHGYGLFESLRAADKQIADDKQNADRRNADERRRKAVAEVLRVVIRAEHPDKKMADLAEACVDIERLANDTMKQFDYDALSARVAKAMTPPSAPKVPTRRPVATRELGPDDDGGSAPGKPGPKPSAPRGPRKLTTTDRILRVVRRNPGKTSAEIAAKAGVSERTVQRALRTENGDTGSMRLAAA